MFGLGKSMQKTKIPGEKLLNVVIFQDLVLKCCKMWKYSLVKFANFLYFCIACQNYHCFEF